MDSSSMSLRMPNNLREAIRRIAEATDRSMTQQIIRFLKMSIADFEKANPDFDLGPEWETPDFQDLSERPRA